MKVYKIKDANTGLYLLKQNKWSKYGKIFVSLNALKTSLFYCKEAIKNGLLNSWIVEEHTLVCTKEFPLIEFYAQK